MLKKKEFWKEQNTVPGGLGHFFNYTVPLCKWVVASVVGMLSLGKEWSPCAVGGGPSKALVRFLFLVRESLGASVLIPVLISFSVNIMRGSGISVFLIFLKLYWKYDMYVNKQLFIRKVVLATSLTRESYTRGADALWRSVLVEGVFKRFRFITWSLSRDSWRLDDISDESDSKC